MSQPNELDVGAHAEEALSAAPGAEFAPIVADIGASPAASQPLQPLFPVEASQRHGRLVGKVLRTGYNRATGKDLEQDISETAGEAMGEVLSVISGTGNKLLYWALMGLGIMPILLIIIREVTKATREVNQ